MSLEGGGRIWQSVKIYVRAYAGVDVDMIIYAIKSECHDALHYKHKTFHFFTVEDKMEVRGDA